MATVYSFLKDAQTFTNDLQKYVDHAESIRRKRYLAVVVLQRMTRGYLIRKHLRWLNHNAIIIQCAFRVYQAKKAYRLALKMAVQNKQWKYYNKNASKIQALWRGYWSRKTKFDYYAYRKWLAVVTERAEKKTYEATTFGVQSRTDSLKTLEAEARQWLAYVVFRLHHLLRTYSCAGIYSEQGSYELSQFERLLTAIRYKDYMDRLKLKYNEFVKEHKPKFSNKRLFPIIGEGNEYWYFTLPEMYELTVTEPIPKNTRFLNTHHGSIHQEPFLWRKPRPASNENRRAGPFTAPKSFKIKPPPSVSPPPPPTTPTTLLGRADGDSVVKPIKDPRFHLYVKHYKPDPDVFDYVNYHINVLLKRKDDLHNLNYPEKDSYTEIEKKKGWKK